MYIHHQGAVHLRQFDKQQGALLRVRTGRGDREESHFHAHEGGSGVEEVGGCGAGPPARKRREDGGTATE